MSHEAEDIGVVAGGLKRAARKIDAAQAVPLLIVAPAISDCACWQSACGLYFCGKTAITTAWSAVGVAIMSTCPIPGTIVTGMLTTRRWKSRAN